MYRHTIHLQHSPKAIRARTDSASAMRGPAGTQRRGGDANTAENGTAMGSPSHSGVSATAIQQLLIGLQQSVQEVEQRRQQSLGELQQLAIELAVAAASHLTFAAIERGAFAVDQLVAKTVETLGPAASGTIFLHPADLQLLQEQLNGAAPWDSQEITLQADAGVARGGCRAETPNGRMLVSDIVTRLSEVRRHWMEELDDAQIERRSTQEAGRGLRRFPDRRATA